jgi:hypothetical protein
VSIGEADESLINEHLVPRLTLNAGEGLKVSGVVGNKYRIEYCERLEETTEWKELRTFVLKTNDEIFPPAEIIAIANRFYRAVWLP